MMIDLDKAVEWLKENYRDFWGYVEYNDDPTEMFDLFRRDMEAVIKDSLNPEFDAEYLQSKIGAFTEAGRKDGKTADEMLDDCRGGALELTWRDMQKIVQIEESMVAEDIAGELEHLAEPEAYYSEILKRFKEIKDD